MSGATYDQVVVRYAGDRSVLVGTAAATNTLTGFIEATNLTTREQAVEYGTSWLALHGSTVDQVSIGIEPTLSGPRPYDEGLNKGDAVIAPTRAWTAEDPDGHSGTNRIHSVGFTGLARNGRPRWSITLGTRRQEDAVAAERRLSKIGGAMGGSFQAMTPNSAPSFGTAIAGQLPQISLPVADTDTMSLEEPYDRTSPYRFSEPTAIVRLQCQAESLDGTLDTKFAVFRIRYSGSTPTSTTQLQTWTWSGTKRLFQGIGSLGLVFAPNEAFQIRITQAGSHRLLSIQPIGSSAN